MKRTISALALGLMVAGCSNSTDDQLSSDQNDSSGTPKFGSATDIAQKDGTTRSTNDLNAADDGIGGPVSRAAGNYQSQPLPGQSSDEELAKKIKVALTTGSVGTTGVIAADQLTDIQVQVQDGVVTLGGVVSSPDEKASIGDRVKDMNGVESVQNNLTVGNSNGRDIPLQPRLPRSPGNP